MSVARTIRPLHVFESWRPIASRYASRSWNLIVSQLDHPQIDPRVLISSRQFTFGSPSLEIPQGHEKKFVLCAPSNRERLARKLRSFSLEQGSLVDHLEKAVRNWSPDLVHVHWSSRIGRAAALVADRHKIPLVAEVRFDLAGAVTSHLFHSSSDWLAAFLRRRFDSHPPRAAAIVAAGPSLTKYLEQCFPALRSRIFEFSNGTDLHTFSPGIRDQLQHKALGLQDKLVIGTTSRMLFYEGLDQLLHAIPEVRKRFPHVQLLLIGEGPQMNQLKRLAATLDIPATFTGRVAASEIPSYLRQIDLFVVPRRDMPITRNAGPIKVVEAMSAGLAIIATPVGDSPTLPANGRGYLIKEKSIAAISDAILELAADADRRYQLGKQAREFAVTNLDLSASSQRHHDVYSSVIE